MWPANSVRLTAFLQILYLLLEYLINAVALELLPKKGLDLNPAENSQPTNQIQQKFPLPLQDNYKLPAGTAVVIGIMGLLACLISAIGLAFSPQTFLLSLIVIALAAILGALCRIGRRLDSYLSKRSLHQES